MMKQKAVFDRKLQEQEEKNRLVVKENAKIAQNIMCPDSIWSISSWKGMLHGRMTTRIL